MANTSPVYARIDTKLKQDAEKILEKLGITPTSLITMVYSQVVLKEALPFTPSIKEKKIFLDELTEEEVQERIQKGKNDIKNGKMYSAEEVDAILKEKYGI